MTQFSGMVCVKFSIQWKVWEKLSTIKFLTGKEYDWIYFTCCTKILHDQCSVHLFIRLFSFLTNNTSLALIGRNPFRACFFNFHFLFRSRIYNRGPHNLVEVNLLKVNMMPETEIVWIKLGIKTCPISETVIRQIGPKIDYEENSKIKAICLMDRNLKTHVIATLAAHGVALGALWIIKAHQDPIGHGILILIIARIICEALIGVGILGIFPTTLILIGPAPIILLQITCPQGKFSI